MNVQRRVMSGLRIVGISWGLSGASRRSWRALGASLVLSLAVSGCVTSLGYYQNNLKAKQVKDFTNWVPDYVTVKHWAYDVQDGFDSRATLNHYALEYGTLFALAAAGTMAGLGIFSPGSPALQGIPLGTAFLGGAAAYYDNQFRYDMYSRASARVRALIEVSDERVTMLTGPVSQPPATSIEFEAICLKEEVGRVIDLVRRHIALSDPKNLAAELRSIQKPMDQGKMDKLDDLVKAAQGDLSDLNIPNNLPEIYCKGTGLPLPGPLEKTDPLITTTQMALVSLSQSRGALNAAITQGDVTIAGLTTQVNGLVQTKGAGDSKVKEASIKIKDLEKAIQDGKDTKSRAATEQAVTAAGYIATLRDNATTRQTRLQTAFRLYDERDRIKTLDADVANATAMIDGAVTAAGAAIKAAQ